MPRSRFSFRCMASNVGATVTSLEVENSIFSSALRSIPSAMVGRGIEEWMEVWAEVCGGNGAVGTVEWR